MITISLPETLPGTLDLAALNRQLRAGTIRLDWAAVARATPDALRALLAGLDLSDDADLLGLGTVPEPLLDGVSAALDSTQHRRGTTSRQKREEQAPRPTPRAAALWPQPATQLALPEDAALETVNAIEPEPATGALGGESKGPIDDAQPPVPPVLPRIAQAALRRQLQALVAADLLGPAGGEEEEVGDEDVTERYLVGMIAPQRVAVRREAQDALAVSADDGASEDGDSDQGAPASTTLFPSSLGFTCSISGEARTLRVTARWGRYERTRSTTLTDPKSGNPKMVWKRRQMSGSIDAIPLCEGEIAAQPLSDEQPEVYVRGQIRRLEQNWLCTLFLVNGQPEPQRQADRAWLFQAELAADAPDATAIFCRHPIAQTYQHVDPDDQRERRAMAMLYRHQTEFAVGHGVAVHAVCAPGVTDAAVRIETRAIPSYEVPQTVSPSPPDIPRLDALVLDMKALAQLDAGALVAALSPLPATYARWIEDQAARTRDSAAGLADYQQAAQEALTNCRAVLQRIREGIGVLEQNDKALQCFRFMNRAMWLQRIHTLAAEATRRGELRTAESYDEPKHRTWRLFQLAFILINLPALTDLRHPDRSASPDAVADLLWFPTGGGKTEAYLGLTAYTLAIRRLHGPILGRSGEAGVAVLMRYTLRLLTLQQFQRASALICACEHIRQGATSRGDLRWGTEPFRLGLWVGQRTTPNWTDQSAEAILQEHGRYRQASAFGGSGTPAQLTNCPWCGAKIDPGRHIKVSTFQQGTGRTLIYCGDQMGGCPFSERWASGEGLPVIVVDEEIYRRLPSLVIATVDKFAQLPWKGAVSMLFGRVNGHCPRHGYRSPDLPDSDSHPARNGLPAVRTQPCGPLRPPDLIIQDELHLISGPLGTLVGLYESAVDALATWDVLGQRVRPKVIASSATVRRATEQMHALFLRRVNVFPPHGLDAQDNFFSRQCEPSDDAAGRLYVGICAPGRRMKRVLIRVYAAYLLAAQALYLRYGTLADPWMTLVGYFNSIRELAGMRRLVEENVRTALDHGEQHGFSKRHSPILEELTSRKGSSDIPALLDRMEIAFSSETTALRRQKSAAPSEHPLPLDVLLATNMISVGVDVKRLGLMVVASQPKTTAEYIQATSRVGRAFPGLVCTVLNWTRPRDVSHYEAFEHYHATFYSHVEALTVTPFAPRALDRGLSALLVTLIRQRGDEYNANDRAGRLMADHPYVREAIETLVVRAKEVTGDDALVGLARHELSRRLDTWLASAADRSGGRVLGYQERDDGKTLGLLHPPDLGPWQVFTCLNSLRDVEPTTALVLDDRPLGDEGARRFVFVPTADDKIGSEAGEEQEGQNDDA